MSVQVSLSAEGANQTEAYEKILRMARVLKGKRVYKKGYALPVKIGNETVGSVQVEGVPDEPERQLRIVGHHPAWQPAQ